LEGNLRGLTGEAEGGREEMTLGQVLKVKGGNIKYQIRIRFANKTLKRVVIPLFFKTWK